MSGSRKVAVAGAILGLGLFGSRAVAMASTDSTGPGPDTQCSTDRATFHCHNWGSSAGSVTIGYTCPGYDLQKGDFWINAGGDLDGDFLDGTWGILVCSSPIAYAYPNN